MSTAIGGHRIDPVGRPPYQYVSLLDDACNAPGAWLGRSKIYRLLTAS